MSFLSEGKKYIISQNPNKENGQDFLINAGIKLSEIFSFLPHGRINKKETGIGATYLELQSERNSIIVFPTRHTAFSKSGGDVHYFSSDRLTKVATQNKEDKLKRYLEDSRKKFNKITVVADSLPKLIDIIGKDVYTNYFLLLDEIDSIQKDSTFRKKMEICMELYKKFDFDKRAVVSATLLDFSDPILKAETLTNFQYEKTEKGQVSLIQTKTILPTATEKIQELLHLNTGKIVVAVNEIESILTIADYLVEQKFIEYNDMSILCGTSPQNKERIAKFNDGIISNFKYPCKLNFLTSANFTGYDINETYHLVIISNPTYEHTRLSEFEMIQIGGRCRLPNKLLSYNIIYSIIQLPLVNSQKDINDLIKFSQLEIRALNCISNHYHTDELGKDKAEVIRALLVNNSGYGNFNFVCKDSSGKYVTSYLNIDAYNEDQRLKHLIYSDKKYLVNYFKSISFSVDFSEFNSSISLVNEKTQKEKIIEQHNKTFEFLFNRKNITQSEIDTYTKNTPVLSVKMCEFYLKASGNVTAINIKKYLKEAHSVKKVNELLLAYSNCLIDKKEFNKSNILKVFPIGLTITPLEKDNITEEILTKLSLVEPSRYNKSKGDKLINSFIELLKTSKNINGIKTKAYKVKSHNPYNFRFKKKNNPKNILN